MFAFSLKSETNFSSTSNGGTVGIFLLKSKNGLIKHKHNKSFWSSMRICKFIGHIKTVVLFSLKNFHGAFCRFIQYFIIITFYLTLFLKIFCQSSSVLTFFLSFYVTIHPWRLTVVALNLFFFFFFFLEKKF